MAVMLSTAGGSARRISDLLVRPVLAGLGLFPLVGVRIRRAPEASTVPAPNTAGEVRAVARHQIGRPDTVAGVKVTTVRLPDELANALDAEAKRVGTSSSELLRRGAALYLAVVVAAHASEAGADLGELLPAILAALTPPAA
jgi:predicted transcriptional regulator